MFTRRAVVAAVTGGVATAALTPAAPISSSAYRTEADAIRRFVERTHPRGVEAIQDRDWRRRWSDIHDRGRSFDDGAYVAAVRKALGWFRDGHTNVVPFEYLGEVSDPLKRGSFGLSLPLSVRAFHDGMWVTRAKGAALPLLGCKVSAVNGVPIETIVRRFCTEWPSENLAWGHNWAHLLFGSLGFLRGYLEAAQTEVAIAASDVAGEARSVALTHAADGLESLTHLQRAPSEREAWASRYGRDNYVHALPDQRSLYVALERMEDLEGYSLADLTREVLSAVESPTVERIVIDLRHNGGGDNYLAEALRRELARSRFNHPGRLFVLTAPQTFSAAQNFANRLERETFATFVGEPTGSAPNLHGDPRLFAGEHTGITIMASTLRWYDGGPNDARRWIFPDLHVPNRFSDWAAGRDLALEAALSASAQGSDRFEIRARYFERASQSASWTPFWRREEAL
jgi:hypothetical protein